MVPLKERLARQLCAMFYRKRDFKQPSHPDVIRDVECQWEAYLPEAEKLIADYRIF